MTMAATAFKLKGNTDKHTKEILVMGFTGQLKGWWDNLLSSEDKYQIDSAVKIESNEEICVTTLLYAITKFFVGEPLKVQQRAADQLLHIYCPTMSDYRWYRDMFLSKLCLGSDGAADYWKERFISGLRRLFAEKVKINIKQNFNGTIAYQSLTIGKLYNYVIETGIQICTNCKLQNKIKNEKASNRREMGSFCEQYGATPLRAPSNPQNKKPASKGRNNFRYHKKQFYKDKPEFYKKPYKKNYGKKPYRKYNNKSKPKDEDVKCYKCGRFGHYANKCKVQEKINQLSNLDLSEELKENLITTLNNILLNSEEEG
ncbi:uncharacterized protein LOC127121866 [Lathyrus oleraceus]|uniref:uncharacterized protein LOC127121866 n=1 Tax=Pisum sativum TaxID=3888 RepID=UPI0021D24397|nr:uncharacterized protein LOC127121866 [Pisum sativum]